ncbi:hypothetical protein K450DRAFT_247763 [Umbelopsis ramanniana AG]|uniref:DNA ligase 4 n=1 Tax=Umbelopsis ramanniana AG TaxID=1314678 RepID=A0AAD5E8Q7_UMBRA|nr:uncharacterized protein K450DRAFT_247763 [Umbelopsis ramanniana AG]KAI8578405.1 hypothetical protein K450DRAFT_247763 [Umbelopsis ramanniana AG]
MSDSPLFADFCNLLQTLSNQRGTEEKKKRLRRFVHTWRVKYGDFLPAMRLLLPQVDKNRYRLKESRLAKAYIDALGLGRDSEDAYELLKWKLPSSSKYSKSSGDFSAVAYEIIRSRSTVTVPTRTVHETVELLDDINASSGNEKKQSDYFKFAVTHYTAEEHQWLIRTILKDLKIGMSETSVFDVYHPQAKELYSVTSDLKKVCEKLQDPFARIGKSTIQLFHPFKPQLGQKQVPKNVKQLAHNGRFYIEEKVDGERAQMHYEKLSGDFKWFSRKATDYTDLYGSSKDSLDKLSGQVASCLAADSFILDGELVAYDPQLDVFLPFGTLKSSVLHGPFDIDDIHPCFLVFDIVYCNGVSLIDHPMEQRLEVLKAVVTERRGCISFIFRKEGTTFQHIVQALDEATTLNQEGIVVKNPGSIYEPGARNHSWVKVKPDYIDELRDNCDLLIVGADYGTGKRGSKLSQFLCAIRDDRLSSDESPKFATFAWIGTGYTVNELEEFSKIRQHFRSYNPRSQPEWLVHPEKSSESPDMIIDYHNSIVVEVKAAEICYANTYGSGYSLRFPRFARFRPDKSWKDCMTYQDVVTMKREGGQMNLSMSSRRPLSQDTFLNQKKKRLAIKDINRKRKGTSLIPTQIGTDSSGIKIHTSLFEGMTFYVVSGDDSHNKAELEKVIKSHGGSYEQTAKNANYVIAGSNINGVRIMALIQSQEHDIILPTWIMDCVKSQDIVPITPKYTVFLTKATKDKMSESIDPWGDSYTEQVNEQSLREIFQNIRQQELHDSARLIDDIKRKYFPRSEVPGFLFWRVTALLDFSPLNAPSLGRPSTISVDEAARNDRLDVVDLMIQSQGGTTHKYLGVDGDIDTEITHVVLDDCHLDGMQRIFKALTGRRQPRFVSMKWVSDCLDNRSLLDERLYEPRTTGSRVAN